MPRPSTTANRPRLRRHLRAAVAAAALAGLATGALAGTAAAADKTTTWYSIDQKPATATSPAQFLTATSTGQVVLQQYASGELRQQWTPMYPEWPYSPTITASSAVNDFLSTLGSCLIHGCGFSAPATFGSPKKYVNRQYAMCLTFTPTGTSTSRVEVARCKESGAVATRQLFATHHLDKTISKAGGLLPRSYTELVGNRVAGQARCLDSAGGGVTPGVNAAAIGCGTDSPIGTAAWSQQFRFLQSASATCPSRYAGTVCGLQAPAY